MKLLKCLLVIFVVLLIYSCSTEPENDYIVFKIKVDKLTFPDTVSVNDSLTILFDGFVGSDGCHRFTHFEEIEKVNELQITVWGSKPNFDIVCPAVIVNLDGKEYNTLFKQIGIHKIVIHQPDNSLLIDSVFVQ
jgi:hypothetical protein